MAELVLSPLIELLFEKLTDAALKTIARHKGIDAEIKKWQKSLISIQLYLTHASQMEITDPSVKQRLNHLQHLAYDIDDVLDGWLTEAMDPEFTPESEGITSKVRKLLPTCCTNFSRTATLIDELDDISNKLQDLVKEKTELGLDNIGLKVEEGTRPRNNNNTNRRFQSSVVDTSSIVGRQDEKDALIQQLLLPADEPCDQNFSIVPIVGMGGVGKTTLARLLYNEKQVNDHFELKAWVCVSDDFDSFRISKEILQSMANKEVSNFNQLQEALRDTVQGKKILLVLDDIWSESYADWETLVRPFFTCASGSKIIITTRKVLLVDQLVYNPLNKQLLKLSDDDALSLVARHALGVNNFDSQYESFKPYADDIVKKCGGLPLALVALGRLLRTKHYDEEHWMKVSNNDIWKKEEGGILPALRLSYDDLSAPLKKLFAYCSLFPKDFLFDKEQLVLLWIAEGLLHRPIQIDSTEEELQRLGHEFFDELLSRSFFQHAPNSESLFVMHDLMNDLAAFVAAEFFIRLDNESEKNIWKVKLDKYRHMSFVREEYVDYKKFESFERAKSLRTLLATSVGEVESWGYFYLSNKILTDLLPRLPLLRVLYLSDFTISEVPESIGTLRHLRYLNLCRTRITHLPETVCNLYNLHTLILFGCDKLTKLPNNFLKLKNLWHLDVKDTPLLFQMLVGLGKLKSQQIILSNIIIESESGFEIAKVKDFKNLCGKISIEGLEKVQNAVYAHEANFPQKRISELELVWSDELNDSRNEILEKEVLNELQPCHEKLIQLKVKSYGGSEFPKWVGDPLFLHLKHVSISGCKRCTSLPPLEQLSSLKELFIDGLYGVEVVGFELFGAGRTFPSLEILSFEDMRGWKKWSGVVLPRLQRLEIKDCPNLVEVTLEALPSLNDLRISKCDSSVLRRLVEMASTVTKLDIKLILGLNDVVWRDVIEYLGVVEELNIESCNEIRYLVGLGAVASKILMKLRILVVWGCDNMVSIGEKEEEEDSCRSNILPSLRILDIRDCKNMERCSCPDGIEEVSVWHCSSMTVVSFPKGGQEKLRSLSLNDCSKLLERELRGQEMNNGRGSFRMLEYVWINGWSNLKSIIELNCCVHLTRLIIYNCESLKSFPENLTLKELEIVNCPKLDGSSFVGDNWMSLEKLIIRNCKSMDASLPGWVWPPNLRFLILQELKKPISEWGPQKKFPTSLVELRLFGEGEDGVDSCSQLSHLLPSSLASLEINGFKKLESVVSVGLQHLTTLQSLSFWNCPNLMKVSLDPQHLSSLHHLSFYNCPKMKDLPQLLFPSLLRLKFVDCPNLEERYCKNRSYWPLISHIPCITTALFD